MSLWIVLDDEGHGHITGTAHDNMAPHYLRILADQLDDILDTPHTALPLNLIHEFDLLRDEAAP